MAIIFAYITSADAIYTQNDTGEQTQEKDLGLLGRFIPATKARDAISNRVRGLLT
jgi:hypothetical protein